MFSPVTVQTPLPGVRIARHRHKRLRHAERFAVQYRLRKFIGILVASNQPATLRNPVVVQKQVWTARGGALQSATSYQQLRDEALSTDRWNRLHPESEPKVPYVHQVLEDVPGPVIAATDFIKTVPDLIRPWINQRYVVLGTDGFGRSDTREALRRFFEVDAENIAIAALYALSQDGLIPARDVARAIKDLGVDPEKLDPLHPRIPSKVTSMAETKLAS